AGRSLQAVDDTRTWQAREPFAGDPSSQQIVAAKEPPLSVGQRMYELPLHFRSGRLFVEQDGELWLLDTGAPCGFGHTGTITFAGGSFSLASDYLGLAAEALSRFTGVRCVGLLGADVLGRFDHILDVPN